MTATRPPAPTTPAVGPATCAAAVALTRYADDLVTHAAELAGDDTPTALRDRHAALAEAARLLRAAGDLLGVDVVIDELAVPPPVPAAAPRVPRGPSPADLARRGPGGRR